MTKELRQITTATNSVLISPPSNSLSQQSESTKIGVSADYHTHGMPHFTTANKVNKHVPAPAYTPPHHVCARSGRQSSPPTHSQASITPPGNTSSFINPKSLTTVPSYTSTSLGCPTSADPRRQSSMARPPGKPKPGINAKATASDAEKKNKRSGLLARYLAPPGFVKLRGHTNKKKEDEERREGNVLPLRILKKEEFRMEISEPVLTQSTLYVPDSVQDAEKLGRHDSHHVPPLLSQTQSQDGNSSAETMAGSSTSGSGSENFTSSSESSHSYGARREDDTEAEGGGEDTNRTRRPPFHRDLRKPTSTPLISPSPSTSVFPRSELASRPASSNKAPSSPSRLFHLPLLHTPTPSSKTKEIERAQPEWYTNYQAAKRETERQIAQEEKIAREKRKVEAKKREKEERRERERAGAEMLRREGVVGVGGVGGGMGMGLGMPGCL